MSRRQGISSSASFEHPDGLARFRAGGRGGGMQYGGKRALRMDCSWTQLRLRTLAQLPCGRTGWRWWYRARHRLYRSGGRFQVQSRSSIAIDCMTGLAPCSRVVGDDTKSTRARAPGVTVAGGAHLNSSSSRHVTSYLDTVSRWSFSLQSRVRRGRYETRLCGSGREVSVTVTVCSCRRLSDLYLLHLTLSHARALKSLDTKVVIK
jgi:hypothetical protein